MSTPPVGSGDKTPKKKLPKNPVRAQRRQENSNPFWHPPELQRAQEEVPEGIRLTRSKLRTVGQLPQQTTSGQTPLHSTPQKQVEQLGPILWPEIIIEPDTDNESTVSSRVRESDSDIEQIQSTANNSPTDSTSNSNVVSILDSTNNTVLNDSEEKLIAIDRITPVISNIVNRSLESTGTVDNTTTASFHSAAESDRTANLDLTVGVDCGAIEPDQQNLENLDITVRPTNNSIGNMAEKEPQKEVPQPEVEELFEMRGVQYSPNDLMEVADIIETSYIKIVQFQIDTNDYKKVSLDDLTSHQKAIFDLKNDITKATHYMETIDKGLATDIHFPELTKKLEDLWHTVAMRMKDLRVQALVDRQNAAKKAQEALKAQRRFPGGQGGAHPEGQIPEGGRRPDQHNDDEFQEETAFTMADRMDLDRAQEEIERLKEMIEDLSQQSDEPRHIKKRPPTTTLQKFKGSKKDYIRFKQSFKDAYEGVGLSNVSLAINLNEFLEGEPRQKLSHLVDNVDKHTYDTMWKCLDTFYGNEKEKARERFLKFESMPAVKAFNASTISILITALESNWQLLQQYSNDNFLAEDNIHLFAFLKKIPLVEKDRFLDYCHYSSKRANFPVFKEWLTERWHRLKDASDSSKPDRALQYWQDDMPAGQEARFFHDISDSTDELEVNWEVVTQEGGQCYYRAPEDEDSGLFQYNNGKFQRVKKVVFNKGSKGSYPNQTSKQNRGFNRPPSSGGKPQGSGSDKSTQKPLITCPNCKKEGHGTYQCEAFKALSLKDKYAKVRELKLCLRCLSVGHMAKDCRMKFVCDVEKCGRRHHRLLHPTTMNKSMYQAYFTQGVESDLDSGDEYISKD